MRPVLQRFVCSSCLSLLLGVTGSSLAQEERRPAQQDDRPYVASPAPIAQAPREAAREPDARHRGEDPIADDPRARWEAQRRESGVQTEELQANILRERRARAEAARNGGADGPASPSMMSPPAPVWLPIGPTGADYEQNGVTYFERDSGRARKILPHPSDPDTVYFLSSGGGLWRTNDFTAHPPTWTPLQDALGTTSGGSVAFGRTPNVLYLGTGDFFDLVNVGGSIAKSIDGGTTWGTEVDLGDVLSIRDIGVDTSAPDDIVLVATDFGFYRSTDGGVTFHLTASGPGQPFQGKSMWSLVRTSAGWLASAQPCGAGFLGVQCGQAGTISLSTDHGATWAPVPNAGRVYSGAGRTTLAVGAPGDAIVYAFAEVTATTAQKDLFRSTDGGRNWTALGVNSTKVPTNPDADNPNMNLMHNQAYYNQLVLVDPRDAARNTVYLGGNLSTAKTTDGGATWTLLSNWVGRGVTQYVHADGHAAAFIGATGTTPATIVFGTDGGLFASVDDGATWSSEKNNGLQTFLFYSIAGTPGFPSAVFGGAQDNGTRVRKDSTTIYNQTLGGDGLGTGWGQTNGYAAMASVQGNQTRRSFNGIPEITATWEPAMPPILAPDTPVFSTPVETPTPAADPTGKVFFTGSALSVFKTADAGVTWTTVGKVGSTIPSGVSLRGQVHGVGVSPADLQHIGAVGASGQVVLTANGGVTWTVRDVGASFATGFLNASALTWADNSTIYVTSVAPTAGQVRVARSTDGGATWARADGGLPDVPTTRVVLDPRDATHDTLFAATHVGIFRTTDGGASWSQYGVGLPSVVVSDLYMPPSGSYLRAATYGRGFWELPFLNYVSSSLTEDAGSGDHDGSLDDGETGLLTVTLHNDGGVALSGISATVTSANPAVRFPSGNTVSFPTAPAASDTTASIAVALDGASGIQSLDFAIAFDDPALALPDAVSVSASFLGNLDEIPSASGNDSASRTSAWTVTGSSPSLPDVLNWERHQITPSQAQWFEVDSKVITDQALVSPVLHAGSGSLTLSFDHFYVYDFGGTTFFDGMVLELSDNGGPWTYIPDKDPVTSAPIVSPPYDHLIAAGSGNPIGGRKAFSGRSAGYPGFIHVTVDLGSAYAGHDVRLRFRVGTDDSFFAAGVHLRNIVVGGITNTPFTTIVAQSGTAGEPVTCPVAVAPGAAFTATVNGGSSARDWVASYAAGRSNNRRAAPRQVVPLPRPAVVAMTAPGRAGSYELRLFADATFTLIGSCTYHVAPVI